MEITFTRTTHYSVDVSTKDDYKSLAKALDITVKKLKKLIAYGELLDDGRDHLVGIWLDEQPNTHSILDEEGIEDMEVHAVE